VNDCELCGETLRDGVCTSPHPPNYRKADCCATCRHYEQREWRDEGTGACRIHRSQDVWDDPEDRFVGGFEGICDDYERGD
jgi:hypothetical protein